jgi:CDP-diacylglycerol--glycerol-3-phosphate 3-phosphatidyltransferase
MKAKHIPISLILFRLVLAPILIIVAYFLKTEASGIILVLMYLGLLSDIFDGIIARKLNVSTEKLRRLDSQIDIIFWLAIATSTWIIHPTIVLLYDKYILGLLCTEALCYLVSFIKFRKETCTHAWLSKLWGLSLITAFTSILGFGYGGAPMIICVALGFASHLDVILITLILPKWTHDIPSTFHALKIRKGKEIKRYKMFNG